MSESQIEEDAEFPAIDIDDPIEAEAAPPKKRKRRIGWIFLLLLLAILAGAAWYGWNYWLPAQMAGDDSNLLTQLEAQQSRTQDNARAIESLRNELAAAPQTDVDAQLDALQQNVEERITMLDSLPGRLSAVESSVASLAGISEGARETFLLAEAEYYLQIANAQLQLANNPQLASLALGMADERVAQLADPRLTAVRRALKDDLAALDVMEKPDIAGASLTLASLSRVVDSLPLASFGDDGGSDDVALSEDASQVSRAWSSVKGAFSGMVKVTPPDQSGLVRLTPDAEYFLRSNLALQLQAARFALLRGEQEIFDVSLNDSSALLQEYFDTSSEQVAGALATLDEVQSSVFAVSAPDISTSLRLLKQHRALRGTAE